LLLADRKSYLPEDLLAREKEGIQKEKYEGDKDKKVEEESNHDQGTTRTNEENKESLIERLKSNLQYLENDAFTGEIFQKVRISFLCFCYYI